MGIPTKEHDEHEALVWWKSKRKELLCSKVVRQWQIGNAMESVKSFIG